MRDLPARSAHLSTHPPLVSSRPPLCYSPAGPLCDEVLLLVAAAGAVARLPGGAAEVRPRRGRGAAEVRPRSSREEAAPAPLRSSCPRPPPKARPAPRAPLRGAAAPKPRARQAGPEPRKGLVRVLSQQRLDVAWSQGQRRRAVRHRVLVLAEPRVAGGAVAVKHPPLGALCGHRHEGSAASAMAEPAERRGEGRGEMRAH